MILDFLQYRMTRIDLMARSLSMLIEQAYELSPLTSDLFIAERIDRASLCKPLSEADIDRMEQCTIITEQVAFCTVKRSRFRFTHGVAWFSVDFDFDGTNDKGETISYHLSKVKKRISYRYIGDKSRWGIEEICEK